MNDINSILSDFIFCLNYNSIPAVTKNEILFLVVDYYSACFAGKRINNSFNHVLETVIKKENILKESSVLICSEKMSAQNAAYLNSVYAHGADMDDGNKKAMGHVGCHVISTAFAVAEETGASGKSLITAIIVGYEVYNRLAAAVQPGLLRRGFHSTGVAGYLACAAVAAKLYGLNPEQIYHALSFAAVQSSGLIIITESGQECKPINPANAARTGIFSAKCAEKGLIAPKNIFESDKGWVHAFSDTFNGDTIINGLGSVFTIDECYMKPYPSCRHTHGSVECAENIRNDFIKKGFSYKNIKSVQIKIYRNAILVAGCIKKPKNQSETKFSIHYATACMLINGSFGLDDLFNYNRESIFSMIEKIVLIEDDSLENVEMGKRGTSVTVLMDNGQSFSSTVDSPKGEKPNPMKENEIIQKLASCMGEYRQSFSPERVFHRVMKLDSLEEFQGINSLLVK